jgi:hypothetical protein
MGGEMTQTLYAHMNKRKKRNYGIHNVLTSSPKDWGSDIFSRVDGTRGQYVKWSKPGTEKQALHVLILKWKLR